MSRVAHPSGPLRSARRACPFSIAEVKLRGGAVHGLAGGNAPDGLAEAAGRPAWATITLGTGQPVR